MQTYFRILGYGRQYLSFGIIAFLCMVLYALFHAFSLILLGPFMDILFQSTPYAEPELPLNLLSSESLRGHMYYQLGQLKVTYGTIKILPYFCGILFLIILFKNLSRYFSAYFFSPLEQGIVQNIRTQVFHHISRLDLGFFTQHKKGDLIGTVVSDVQVVQEAIVSTLLNIFREPITAIFLLAGLLFISWQLTLFSLIVLPLSGLFINYIRKSLKRQAREGQEVLGDLISKLDEFTGGIRIVKSFQKEAYETQKYDEKNEAYTRLQVSIRRRAELASPVTEIISVGVICIIIIYGGWLIFSNKPGSLYPSDFIVFIALFSQLLSPIKLIASALARIQKGIAAFERVDNLLSQVPAIQEVSNPLPLSEFEDRIVFDQVHFRYDTEDVLKNVSLEIQKGQMVALVGPSGAGKSTLADLIPRFYDPFKGKIFLDDHNIRLVSLANLRGLIGHVSQEGILFHDTVLSNIAYGIEEPDLSSIVEAAKIANAHDFILQLPEQYQTVIGERGTKLSGGQRQRIAIARAILRNPSILILDEATSSLDTESERLVQDALERLMENRTSIVIAHRLSTILKADQILVLENGEIVERGTHRQLLQSGGLYKRLYDLQFEA
ncbi:MAG: ABC transporter ATP-binding protein [Bacteroidota bacterium]